MPDANPASAAIRAEIRAKAVKRMRMKLGFSWHLALFVLVNVALVAINFAYTPNVLWFVWPLCAWGVGVFLHGFAIFGGGGMNEEMLEAEVERELQKRGLSSR